MKVFLKIPFNKYRTEPLLIVTKELNARFKILLEQTINDNSLSKLEPKENYTNVEIMRYITSINNEIEQIFNKHTYLSNLSPKNINAIFKYLKKNKQIELTVPAFNLLNEEQRRTVVANFCQQLFA